MARKMSRAGHIWAAELGITKPNGGVKSLPKPLLIEGVRVQPKWRWSKGYHAKFTRQEAEKIVRQFTEYLRKENP